MCIVLLEFGVSLKYLTEQLTHIAAHVVNLAVVGVRAKGLRVTRVLR
jgi:uncharacterized protein (DUF111 family)